LKVRFLISALVLAGVSGCGPTYSPDTYASNAAQQANKVEQGVIVGVRTVGVSAAGTVGTLTGAAAGGIAGSQAVAGPVSAFTALGGSLVGGIAGSTVEHVTSDTTAFEYIVRKPNGDLISVTQKDKTPLVVGQKVLVIAGNQARIVADYIVPPIAKTAETAEPVKVDASMPKSTDGKPADDKPGGATETASQPVDAKPATPIASDKTAPAPADNAAAAPAVTSPTPAKTADSAKP